MRFTTGLVEAVLLPRSPRYTDWINVFGTDRVPVTVPLAHNGEAPEVGKAMTRAPPWPNSSSSMSRSSDGLYQR